MRRIIIAGNWKMNTSLAEAIALAEAVRDKAANFGNVDKVLIPPFPWILPVSDAVRGYGVSVGAQNCFSEPSGAFTGEVAAEMLADHCSHVVVGHSERRHILGETDETISAKVAAVLRTPMSPILCVGETLDEREAGNATAVVSRHLESGLTAVPKSDLARLVVAYEPVWAIGTGVAASVDDAQEMAAFIRGWVQKKYDEESAAIVRIQYGGSVKATNADSLMACPDVDGALVGGASLDAGEFGGIIRAAASQSN